MIATTPHIHVVAMIAAHNRCASTLRCLQTFFTQTELPDKCELSAVLVDDGSSDDTAESCQARFPRATIIRGDGSLYWARSMALAQRYAVHSTPEYLLWLNDDVELAPTALSTLLSVIGDPEARVIAVGTVTDPMSGMPTYSGLRRTSWKPKHFELVVADTHPVQADAFHGNVVLVPRSVYADVGTIDGAFAHAYADIDYGLRARKKSVQILVASPAVGVCPQNTALGTWKDPSLPLFVRMRSLAGVKGAPIRSQIRYLRRYGGRLWPAYVLSPFVKLVASHVSSRLTGRLRRVLR